MNSTLKTFLLVDFIFSYIVFVAFWLDGTIDCPWWYLAAPLIIPIQIVGLLIIFCLVFYIVYGIIRLFRL